MIANILYTLFGSINSITYKRACDWAEENDYADELMVWTNQAVEWPWYIIATLILPATIGFVWTQDILSPLVLLAFLAIAIADLFHNLISQYVYAHEKISVLQPYGELGGVFMIFASAIIPFLHHNVSNVMIAGAFVVASVLVVANIDFSNFTFNRYCFVYLGSQIFGTIEAVITVWLLSQLTSVTVIAISGLLLLVMATVGLLHKRKAVPVRNKHWWRLAKLTFINDGIWAVSAIAYYFIVSTTSLVFATLLGMLQFAVTLVLSYLVFRDIPSRKNILLGVFVIISVVLLWGGGE